MGFFYVEVFREGAQVLDQMVLRVLLRAFGHARRWKSAVAEGNTAIGTAEEADLRVPAAVVRSKFVAEDDRIAAGSVLVVQLDAIECDAGHKLEATALRCRAVVRGGYSCRPPLRGSSR